MKKLILVFALLVPAVSSADYFLQAGQSLGLSNGSRVYCEQQQREPTYRYSCVCKVKNQDYFQHGVTVITSNPYGLPGLGAILAACKKLDFYAYNIPDADPRDCRRE